MSKGWDSIALKKLKALTGKGLSTSEIGKRLGMSKNAIVGKLNRLGWNAKAGGAATTTKETEKKSTAKKTSEKSAVKKADTKSAKTVEKKAAATKVTSKKTETKVAVKAETKKVATPKIKADVKKAEPKAAMSKKDEAKNLAMHQRIIQHSLEMANLKPNQCRWPIGDPDSEHFHFCGETVFVGKPYCYEHCKQAYQFTPPKKK